MSEVEKRTPCRECSREALVETIERNGGICESCAKGNSGNADEVPTVAKIGCFVQILIVIGVTAYAIHEFDVFEWHWIWVVVFFVTFVPFVAQGAEYLIGGLLWIYCQLRGKDTLEP